MPAARSSKNGEGVGRPGGSVTSSFLEPLPVRRVFGAQSVRKKRAEGTLQKRPFLKAVSGGARPCGLNP